MTKTIPVYQNGQIVAQAKVDDEDYARVSAYRWHMHPRGYAIAGSGNNKVLMHRLILDLANPKGNGRGSGVSRPQADHINHDKLDNRRTNLRVVTNQQNHQNRPNAQGTSKYRGVYRHRPSGKWAARAKSEGRDYWGGYYATELEAAVAAWELRKRLMPFCTDSRPT